jgi:hypothetical protein
MPAGESAGIHYVRHILVGFGDFLIHGAAALAADDTKSSGAMS